ncbi:unnamed protein product [Closterium sp. NIES-53]
MMIYGAVMGCLSTALTIAACLSYRSPFSSSFHDRKAAARARQALVAKAREANPDASSQEAAGGRQGEKGSWDDGDSEDEEEDEGGWESKVETETAGGKGEGGAGASGNDRAWNMARGQQSDHLAMASAFNGWVLALQRGSRAAREFCQKHHLSIPALLMLRDMRVQFARLLMDIGFLRQPSKAPASRGFDWLDESTQLWNRCSMSAPAVKAVLCAGLYPNVAMMARDSIEAAHCSHASDLAHVAGASGRPRWVTATGAEVAIHPSSVNEAVSVFRAPFLVFHEKVKTSRVYIRDCTVVSPAAILLFGGPIMVHHQRARVSVDGWLDLVAPAQTAVLFKAIRGSFDTILRRHILQSQNVEQDADDSSQVISTVVNILADAEYLQGVGDEKHGVAFLLVDPNMSSMTMFISDLLSKVVPGRAVIQGDEGESIASFLINNTFVASNPTGLAFAGVVPLSIASIEALQANPTRFIVLLETGQEDDFAGGIMLPSQAAQLLPSILLPDALLLADPSLYSSLAISFNFYARGEMNVTVGHDPEDPRQRPVLSNITSFDLASSFRAITSALPVAFQAMVAGDEGSDAEISTTLTSFLTSVIPALPALTKALPGVKNGQFLQAGSAALMATMIAYSGFLPPLNSPRILSALSASLETALLVNRNQS